MKITRKQLRRVIKEEINENREESSQDRRASRVKTYEEIKDVLIQNGYTISLFTPEGTFPKIKGRKGAEYTALGEETIEITMSSIKSSGEPPPADHGFVDPPSGD